MVDVVRKMHTASGLLDELAHGTTIAEAERPPSSTTCAEHVPEPRKAPLAGNSVGTDRAFLARDMPELDAHLHYRIVDVSSIKELSRRWYPRAYFAAPPKRGSHRALADIQESIEELQVLPRGGLRAAARPGQRHRSDRRHRRRRRHRHGGLTPPRVAMSSHCSPALPGVMVGVAQLVEHLVVVQMVAGSSPVTHPMSFRPEPVADRPDRGGPR